MGKEIAGSIVGKPTMPYRGSFPNQKTYRLSILTFLFSTQIGACDTFSESQRREKINNEGFELR